VEKAHYIDSPNEAELVETIGRWLKPAWPEKLQPLVRADCDISFWEAGARVRERIRSPENNLPDTVKFERTVLDWLYDYIRLNIIRGRIFNLGQVLKTGRADCLGYAKLFSVLGIRWGMDLGVVEVIIDNRGQSVPHTAALVKLADGTSRFVDFWYGCRNIQHRRMALSVKRRGRWRVEDIDFADFKEVEEISYLPDNCVDAITLYIEGNQALKQKDYAQAVRRYTESIRLYPQNARVYYNRAIASEKLGEIKEAQADYRRALHNDVSILRTLAAQPEDVVDLIRLDEENVPEAAQQEYLRNHGFLEGCDEERVY
jgi:tetratricopeptide (TPR) repeat protein